MSLGDPRTAQPETCIVVSYYDARPIDQLKTLVGQLTSTARGEYDVCVAVNQTLPTLDRDLTAPQGFRVVTRKNSGFNIGAWNHGWEQNLGYRYYIFLQDECRIQRSDWLSVYKRQFEKYGDNVLVGESFVYWSTWSALERHLGAIAQECYRLAPVLRIPLGASPDHLQSLVIGAPGQVMEKLGGFPTDDEKVRAMASEVLISRKAAALGIPVAQSAWRPFECFGHEQWDELREKSGSIGWSLRRVLRRSFARAVGSRPVSVVRRGLGWDAPA